MNFSNFRYHFDSKSNRKHFSNFRYHFDSKSNRKHFSNFRYHFDSKSNKEKPADVPASTSTKSPTLNQTTTP
jgi:hypothetical protein